jgi:peptidyl-prolyl cis-trans isomerase B (cyclophilin B)
VTDDLQLLRTAEQSGVAGPPRTDPLAVGALVSAFFVPIAAIVLGHLALGRLDRTGGQGRGLAIAGLVIGYSTIALLGAFVVGSVVLLLVVAAIPSGFSPR